MAEIQTFADDTPVRDAIDPIIKTYERPFSMQITIDNADVVDDRGRDPEYTSDVPLTLNVTVDGRDVYFGGEGCLLGADIASVLRELADDHESGRMILA